MRKKQKTKIIVAIVCVVILLFTGLGIHSIRSADYTFSHAVSDDERQLRLQFVDTAIRWLGTEGGTPAHSMLLEIYNGHRPLAQGYEVQPDDAWCATFVSAVAIECGRTDIIPTECGCQRQIGLWQKLGRWEEADDYTPQPGDIIYYSFGEFVPFGDATGHSDHVGIVVGTWRGFIKVIEGNYSDTVAYRYIPIDAPGIRGFGLPDYASVQP